MDLSKILIYSDFVVYKLYIANVNPILVGIVFSQANLKFVIFFLIYDSTVQFLVQIGHRHRLINVTGPR